MRSWTVLCSLSILFSGAACSDADEAASDAGDSGGDMVADADLDLLDVSDLADSESDSPDVTADSADVTVDPDVSADVDLGTGTIRGNIFNNTGVTDGRLTVALVESLPVVGDPAIQQTFESPTAPIQPYELTDVPVGIAYYVVAHWDVGGDDSIEAPGDEDLVGQTQDVVALQNDGETSASINVEVF